MSLLSEILFLLFTVFSILLCYISSFVLNKPYKYTYIIYLFILCIPHNKAVALLPMEASAVPAAIHRSADLSFSSADVGRAIQLFSFRMNSWDRIDLLDFEPMKRLHKCKHPDGSVQWLDLAKKPIRAMPE